MDKVTEFIAKIKKINENPYFFLLAFIKNIYEGIEFFIKKLNLMDTELLDKIRPFFQTDSLLVVACQLFAAWIFISACKRMNKLKEELGTAKLDIYEVAVHQKLLLSFLELNYKQFPAQSLADLQNKLSPKWISYFGLQEKQNSKNQNVVDKNKDAENKLNFEIHELFGKKPKILDEALSDDFLTKRG